MHSMIAEHIQEALQRGSWIRRMFEEGMRLREIFGADAVFDFSLGNPILEPPPVLYTELCALLERPQAGMHRYLPNAGLPAAREAVAEWLCAQTGLPYRAQHVVMSCGAAGGLNIVFKTLLNPGDTVAVFTPCFVEYAAYIENHGGRMIAVPCDEDFLPEPAALERALAGGCRAVLINSPNNPTGVVYPRERLELVVAAMRSASARQKRPIMLISDEPYRRIVFDEVQPPWLPNLYEHTVLVSSHSKDLGLAGERLGHVSVHPQMAQADSFPLALALANRVLGFVHAPALMQRALPALLKHRVAVEHYQRIREILLEPLRAMGWSVVKPQGAFFLFPRTPIADDVAFVQAAQEERLLLAPGSGFGAPGHVRIALSVEEDLARRALPVFERVWKRFAPSR